MLQELLQENYGLDGKPVFGYLPKGKPYLINHTDIHFSISHCRKAILCVVSDKEVGCDVEEIFQESDTDLIQACCNDDEIRDIHSSPNPNIEFARIWTKKEALLKLTGEGLRDDITGIFSEDQSSYGFQTTIDTKNSVVHTIAFQKE